jgi:hypothetical protein
MSSVVIALLPILGLNKEKIRGNQEAVLPHNQEAVRGFIGKLPHNSGNWPDDQSAGVLLRSHIIRENSHIFQKAPTHSRKLPHIPGVSHIIQKGVPHISGVFHKFQGSLT